MREREQAWGAWREAVSRHNDMSNHFDADDWLNVRRDFLQWYEAALKQTQAEPLGEAPEIPTMAGTRDGLVSVSVRKGE